jgi:hypothetical protein
MGSLTLPFFKERSTFMKALFAIMLISILSVTTWASFDQSVWEGFTYLTQSRWGIATLFDTYFGFLTIYLWIAYKEGTWLRRAIWLVLMIGLGSIAFSFYILRELYRLPKGAGFEQILMRSQRV